jgi:ribosomal protein S18 acetylase RimI-like enzyme
VTTLHRITPDLTEQYKTIRLRALLDSPSAFGSTYAREIQFSQQDWEQRARNVDGIHAIGYLASENGEYCGLAICFLDETNPSTADLRSMWVAPTHRRSGVGAEIVNAIAIWATTRGATTLTLMVTSSNSAATSFYERLGFTKTGRTQPHPNDAQLLEYEMKKPLP